MFRDSVTDFEYWCSRAVLWMQRMIDSDSWCVYYQQFGMLDLARLSASQVVSCRANYQSCIKLAESAL
jgi:hypothetical protein